MLHCMTHWDVSPLQGFWAGSAARLSSSSLAPSLCWWFVWPDMSADGGEAGWNTSPPPQRTCKHIRLSIRLGFQHLLDRDRKHVKKKGGRRKGTELESNHRLQPGPQPPNYGVHTKVSVSLTTNSLNNKTHQLRASSLGPIVHVFKNKSWIYYSLTP